MSNRVRNNGDAPAPPRDARFGSTRWSVVVAAGATPSPDANRALAMLCEQYWYPLYAFVRRRGYDPDTAQDLTQGFFARLLEKRDIGGARPEKGRFRSFLLGGFVHYLSNERDRALAKKRGGGTTMLSIDFPVAEDRYCHQPVDNRTPEKLYERRWALTLLESVLQQLKEEHGKIGKGRVFEALAPTLTAERGALPYRTLADRLDMSEMAVKVAVHRLRHRYRRLICETVAQTVCDPAEVEEEIRFLFSALSD
jgi:RNA polymerase sigma-70 factor (ECF subfamily)